VWAVDSVRRWWTLQVAVMWTIQNGFMDDVPVERIGECQDKLTDFLTTRKPELLAKISQQQKLDDALIAELKAAAGQFKQTFDVRHA